MAGEAAFQPPEDRPIEEIVVKIHRCATVVKGGRRFSFGALVVVGDRAGHVGLGYGKAKEVPLAVEKGIKNGRKNLQRIVLKDNTIPHRVTGKYGASRVVMVPASPGTSLTAGASVRAVLELAGVRDALTKSYGSTNPKNLVRATLDGLLKLRTAERVEQLRGVSVAM